MTLIFDCICGDTFHEADYPSFAAYRQTTDVHRERCSSGPRAIDRLVVDAVAPGADPSALEPRTVRQATGFEPTPAPPVATQRRGLIGRLLSGVPDHVRRRIEVWPFDEADFTT